MMQIKFYFINKSEDNKTEGKKSARLQKQTVFHTCLMKCLQIKRDRILAVKITAVKLPNRLPRQCKMFNRSIDYSTKINKHFLNKYTHFACSHRNCINKLCK